MEKPILGINMDAAFSFLTEGADQPVTSRDNPPTGSCSLELPIAPPGQTQLKYICIGMLCNIGPLKFYKACQFSEGQCPRNQYKPHKKIVDEPLDIEKKWAAIKAKGR